MPAQIVAVLGLCATGKSELVNRLKSHFAYSEIYFGGFVLDEMRRRGLQISPETEAVVRTDMRQSLGIGILAMLALPRIDHQLAKRNSVVIDGVYSQEEYKILQDRFGILLHSIAVHSDRRIRHVRAHDRKHRPLTKEELDARDVAELGALNKASPIVMADYHRGGPISLDS